MFDPVVRLCSRIARARLAWLLPAAMLLCACVDLEDAAPTQPAQPAQPIAPTAAVGLSETITVASFTRIVKRVEPIAEQTCRARTSGANCDFKIVVETDPTAPSNAYQSEDETGRPVLTFTVALLADVRNSDELAFILGHEAAHHISGHLDRTQSNALAGGLFVGVLAAAVGADAETIDSALELGATVGARSYSKSFELEADQLGTIIAHKAGYNPIRGAAFFTRIPDPGDQFLGSHPPNDARIETVRRTMATL